jgi:hypothetical protein
MPSVPTNKKLYNQIKKKVKARVKVWPSAYASGQLVREYKRRGGKYKTKRKTSFGSLKRWFKEQWVDVCRPKGKGYATCGRKSSSRKGYPYCRPLKRVSKDTPRTVREIGKKKIKEMCKRKRKNPYKRHFVNYKKYYLKSNGKSIRRSRTRKM